MNKDTKQLIEKKIKEFEDTFTVQSLGRIYRRIFIMEDAWIVKHVEKFLLKSFEDLLAQQRHALKVKEPKGYDRDTIICICCKKDIPKTETYTRSSYKFTFNKNNEGLCNNCSSNDLAVAHQEAMNTSKSREHEIRESIKHDLKEQVLEVVGEPIELKTPLTVNYTDMEIKKLLTENELRSDIKERIEAVFEK